MTEKVMYHHLTVANVNSYLHENNPLVNLKSLRNLLKDNAANIVEILRMFISETSSAMVEMKGLCQKQDWEALKLRVHAIKPYYGYIGNAELSQKLEEWERDLADKPQVAHQEIMIELDEKTKAITERLHQIIKEEYGG
jgi:HPt (histidine-containing phosphotransfer) domain-containing protein